METKLKLIAAGNAGQRPINKEYIRPRNRKLFPKGQCVLWESNWHLSSEQLGYVYNYGDDQHCNLLCLLNISCFPKYIIAYYLI